MSKNNIDSIIKYIRDESNIFYPNRSCLRKGQKVFDIAFSYLPNECGQLRGTNYDCFYDDNKIDIFLEKLKELYIGRNKIKGIDNGK